MGWSVTVFIQDSKKLNPSVCVHLTATSLGVPVCLRFLADGFGLEAVFLWPCGGGVCGRSAAWIALDCTGVLGGVDGECIYVCVYVYTLTGCLGTIECNPMKQLFYEFYCVRKVIIPLQVFY